MLEFAAKAYWGSTDVGFWWSRSDDAIVFNDAANQDHNGQDVELVWNPLENKSQLYELAEKLDMVINFEKNFVISNVHVHDTRPKQTERNSR